MTPGTNIAIRHPHQEPTPKLTNPANNSGITICVTPPPRLPHPADAALAMQLGAEGVFVGSGIFKSEEPARTAHAIVQATTHFDNPQIVADVSKGLGAPMRGLEVAQMADSERLAVRGW